MRWTFRRPFSGRILVLASLASVLLLVAAACNDDDDSPTTPVTNVLELTSVSPAANSTVPHSQPVHVRAMLHYRFAQASAGTIVVAVIGAVGSSVVYADAGILRELMSREGDTIGDVTFELPANAAGGALTVQWRLVPQGASTAAASAHVDYRIGT